VQPDASSDETRRDVVDLRRSMRITLYSYSLRFGAPLLLIFVIRLYGAEAFGVYAVVLALLTFVMRVCLLGLDKGLLWWLPGQAPGHQREGIGAVLLLCGLTSALAALGVAFTPWLATWAGQPEATTTLRWMAASLVPMTLSEVFIHACVARRRPEGQIMIKDGLLPVLTAGLALGLHFTGIGSPGLALAHTLAVTLGLAATAGLFGRVYAGTSWSRPRLLPPGPLLRAAQPLWFADLLATAHGRLDLYMLAALSDAVTAGLYQGALQIAQNLLAVRASFDSLVTVLVAEIVPRGGVARLVHGFSHALGLVALVVVPLTAFIFAFAAWILPLLGPGYDQALPAVWILSGFFVIHGTLGMNQQILVGSGRGAWVPLDAALSLLLGGLAFVLLVPRLGLAGAAIANGLTYLTLSLLFIVQARLVVGVWPYDRRAALLLALCALAALTMTGLWLGLQQPLGDWARVAGFLGFLAVFIPGALRLRRTHDGVDGADRADEVDVADAPARPDVPAGPDAPDAPAPAAAGPAAAVAPLARRVP